MFIQQNGKDCASYFLFERKLRENYFILGGVTKGWISLAALIQPDSLAWKADWL